MGIRSITSMGICKVHNSPLLCTYFLPTLRTCIHVITFKGIFYCHFIQRLIQVTHVSNLTANSIKLFQSPADMFTVLYIKDKLCRFNTELTSYKKFLISILSSSNIIKCQMRQRRIPWAAELFIWLTNSVHFLWNLKFHHQWTLPCARLSSLHSIKIRYQDKF
jgi:hypothetical protein